MFWSMEPIGLDPIDLHVIATLGGLISICFVAWSVITDSGIWLAAGAMISPHTTNPSLVSVGKAANLSDFVHYLLDNLVG